MACNLSDLLNMSLKVSRFLIILFFVLSGVLAAQAQLPDASSPDGRSQGKEDYPDKMKETFAKQRIKEEEKEFNEMLGRGEEAAKIGDEVYQSFESNQKLLPDDAKKMERMEKLVKKIRDELGSGGGDDKDESSNNSPLSFNDALKNIRETSSGLFTALKKQGRFSISVVAIESSNTLLKLLRFVRQNQN